MFTTLKSVVAATVIAAMALAASCSYDDSAINERVDRVEKDLAALTERVAALEKKLGEEVDALKKLIEKQTVVTKVEKADDGSTKVTLSDGTSFTVYPKAEAGAEAVDTTIAPNKDTDGTYYWAVFDGGKFQKYLEVDGKKVPVFAAEAEAEGCVCELKFQVSEETGKLLVSIDGGKTWVDSGLAAQQVASTGVFSEVVVNDDNTVTFTLADGDKFSVALAELIECEATRSGVYVLPGEVKAVRFTVNDAVEDINIMNQPHGWAASVEVAPVEEENGDENGDENVDGPAVGPLAVGGTDYVLNIAGPAQGDKYAAKEGVVSVHFNTASGACKVLSVKVNLAELTLSIDNAGNITITNSVTIEQTDHWNNKFVDFADFWIGIMPADLYEANGEDALKNDYLEEGDFKNASATNRTSGLNNSLYEGEYLANYEEGVCEIETISITMEQLCQRAFYPKFNMTLGGRYVVFLSLGDDATDDGYSIPSLENAIVAEYSYTAVDAKLVEGSEKWNDATFDFALAGYTNYIVGWHDKASVDNYISQGICDSYADFLSISSLQYLFGIGTVISGTVDGEVALSKVIKDYLDPAYESMIHQILTNTEYYFFVYPINIQSMMDVYTHEFDVNALVLSSFTTAALVEGEFDAAATYGEHSFEDTNINVPVTIDGDDVVYVAYQFFNEPVSYASDRVEDMFGKRSPYTQLVELGDTKAFSASHYDVSNPCYLSMVLINAYGEYVFVEKEFVEYTEYEFTSCENTEGNTYVFKNDTYTWTLSLKDVLASGTFTQSNTDTYWDGNNTTFKAFADTIPAYIYNGTLTVELGDNDALKVEFLSTDTWIGGKKTPIKFVFDGTIGADQGGNAGVVFTSATAVVADGQPNWHDVTFANGTDTVVIRIATYGTTKCLFGKYAQRDYGQDCCINSYTTTSTWNGVGLWPVTMDVVDNGDNTLSVTIECTEYGGNGDSHVGTFTGVIEGLTFGHPEVAPEFTIPGDGAYDLDLRYTKLVDGLDASNAVKVADENDYDWTIKFNSGLSSIEPGDYKAVDAFTTADAKEVDTYNGGIGIGYAKYFYADEYDNVTINVQKNGDWYCITMIGQGGWDCPVTGMWRVVYIGKIVK